MKNLSKFVEFLSRYVNFAHEDIEWALATCSVVEKRYNLKSDINQRTVWFYCKMVEEWTEVREAKTVADFFLELMQFIDISIMYAESAFEDGAEISSSFYEELVDVVFAEDIFANCAHNVNVKGCKFLREVLENCELLKVLKVVIKKAHSKGQLSSERNGNFRSVQYEIERVLEKHWNDTYKVSMAKYLK